MSTTKRDPRAVLALFVVSAACILAIGALLLNREEPAGSPHPVGKVADIPGAVERPELAVVEERLILDGFGQRKSFESNRSLAEEAAIVLEEQRTAGSEIVYADHVDLIGSRWVGLFRLADERGALMVEVSRLESSAEGGSHVLEVTLDAEVFGSWIADE